MVDDYLQREQAAQLHQWMHNQARTMGQAAGSAAFFSLQTQGLAQGFGIGIGGSMSQPGMPHFGTVKEFRNRFKEYTKAEFRDMGSRPVIKEILSGMTKLNKEEIKDRIAEHLALV